MTHNDERLDDRSGSFLMGMLAGTALGAGLGRLFASTPGAPLGHQQTDATTRLEPVVVEHQQRV